VLYRIAGGQLCEESGLANNASRVRRFFFGTDSDVDWQDWKTEALQKHADDEWLKDIIARCGTGDP
jgi:hypothetical protein